MRSCCVCRGVSRDVIQTVGLCVTVVANKSYVMSVATVTLMCVGWQSADR